MLPHGWEGAAWKCWWFHILETHFYSHNCISLHSPCDKKVCYFNEKETHHDQKLIQDWERPDQTWWLCRMVLLVRWQGTNYIQVQAYSAVSKVRIYFLEASISPLPYHPSPACPKSSACTYLAFSPRVCPAARGVVPTSERWAWERAVPVWPEEGAVRQDRRQISRPSAHILI